MKIYYLRRNRKFLGPFSLDELRSQTISADDYIWKDGTPDWVPAYSLEELACMFSHLSLPYSNNNIKEHEAGKSGFTLNRFFAWAKTLDR